MLCAGADMMITKPSYIFFVDERGSPYHRKLVVEHGTR
jgi:hypothetical protein